MHLDDLLPYWHFHSHTGQTSSGFGWLHRYIQLENITPISPGQVRLNDTSDLVEMQSVKQILMKYLADKISCLNWLDSMWVSFDTSEDINTIQKLTVS